MTLSRRTLLAASAAASTLPLIRPARAQAPVLKIGVLNDQSGPYTGYRRCHLGDLRQAGDRGIRLSAKV